MPLYTVDSLYSHVEIQGSWAQFRSCSKPEYNNVYNSIKGCLRADIRYPYVIPHVSYRNRNDYGDYATCVNRLGHHDEIVFGDEHI
jgi:hypothetical protein